MSLAELVGSAFDVLEGFVGSELAVVLAGPALVVVGIASAAAVLEEAASVVAVAGTASVAVLEEAASVAASVLEEVASVAASAFVLEAQQLVVRWQRRC